MEELEQGLTIVVVGIGGVFFNLLVLMLVITGIGKVFGKKKKKGAKGQRDKGAGASGADAPKGADAPTKRRE